MTRYTIDGSPISVAYGRDHMTGVFLCVYDDRLKYDSTASDEVNEVFENSKEPGLASGDGGYLSMHTGPAGFGIKVSVNVMKVFLQRYGVPENHIAKLIN